MPIFNARGTSTRIPFLYGLPQNLPPRYPETQTQSHSRYLRRRPSVSSCVWCCEWSSRHILQYSGPSSKHSPRIGAIFGSLCCVCRPTVSFGRSQMKRIGAGNLNWSKTAICRLCLFWRNLKSLCFQRINVHSSFCGGRKAVVEISPDFYCCRNLSRFLLQKKWLCEKRSLLPCFRQMGKPKSGLHGIFHWTRRFWPQKRSRCGRLHLSRSRGGGSWGYKSQICYHYMGRSFKWWHPQILHFNGGFHYKPSILGYHHFLGNPHITTTQHKA